MKIKYPLLLAISLFFGINVSAKIVFRTDIFSPDIKTLQLTVNDYQCVFVQNAVAICI